MTDRPEKLAGFVGLLARCCARYRWIVLAAWLVALVPAVHYIRDGGARYTQEVAPAGSESARAMDGVARASPGRHLPDVETIVVRARRGSVDGGRARDRITALVAEVGRLPGVTFVADPAGPLGTATAGVDPISTDRRTALISVLMDGGALQPHLDDVHRVIEASRAYDGPELQVEASGPGATMIGSAELSLAPLVVAAFAALVLLGVTLRSRLGMLVCLLPAAVCTLLAVAVTARLSHTTLLPPFAPVTAGILAFGTCLGSAVVVVHRAQSALLNGQNRLQAAASATTSTGAAVAVGGLGVSLALLAVAALGLSGFGGLALAAAGSAALAVLVVLTLLPALVAGGGVRLLSWAERHYLAMAGAGLARRPGVRSWWAAQVGRYPALVVVAAGVLLMSLANQTDGLRVGGGDAGTDPTSMTTRRAYDLISEGFFPGLNGPILVAVDRGDPNSVPGGGGRVVQPGDVAAALRATPGVRTAAVSLDDPALGPAVVRVLPEAAPRSPQASDLVRRLRDDVLPAALRGSVTNAAVGGPTAMFDDAASSFRATLPLFLAVVVLTIGLVTFAVAGSIPLAVVLGVAGMLSVLASAGMLRVFFQDEDIARRLGVMTSPAEPFVLVPIMLAVFGLAPGMNLVLLTRLRAGGGADPAGSGSGRGGVLRGIGRVFARRRDGARPDPIRDGRDAVRRGHADLGHVVLTMNFVMLFVFLAIAAQPSRTLKMLGCGLAIGVAVDAVVLRAAILPASVQLGQRWQGDRALRRRQGAAASAAEPEAATVARASAAHR
ncbi:MMPL family transporter [Parafrankia discariae]|uniref:MMPL family transporter n=1 Tax=Parafrankia discariae TaxID=365528 RepID=UPI00039C2DF0|nr:MMPL family transporter [Parafrankia discariae]